MEWELYLSRPFSLFGASVWHEWYDSEEMQLLFGFRLPNALYVEHPLGMIRQYRESGAIKKLASCVSEMVLHDPNKIYALLEEGLKVNEQAKQSISDPKVKNLQEAMHFLIRMTHLSTIIPYFCGDALAKNHLENKKLSELCNQLRQTSYYPSYFEKVILPLVRLKLKKLNVTGQNAELFITYQELIQKNTTNILSRIQEQKKGRTFIYYRIGSKESIEWTENPTEFIQRIEQNDSTSKELVGTVAFKGNVVGKVKIVLANNPSEFKFDEGNVLVAISTSPSLLPLMKKAAAFVTDEGGLMCHAAIISRELKKPCIVGTKIATKMLKDGDLVEVDAVKGVVKKL